MPDRAGYQVSVYAIDVSPSMGEVMDDPAGSSSNGKGAAKTKLDFVKEYVARKLEPKVSFAGGLSKRAHLTIRFRVGGRQRRLVFCPSAGVSAAFRGD